MRMATQTNCVCSSNTMQSFTAGSVSYHQIKQILLQNARARNKKQWSSITIMSDVIHNHGWRKRPKQGNVDKAACLSGRHMCLLQRFTFIFKFDCKIHTVQSTVLPCIEFCRWWVEDEMCEIVLIFKEICDFIMNGSVLSHSNYFLTNTPLVK